MQPQNTLLLTRSETTGALPAYPVTNVSERSTFKVRVTNTTPRRALVALAAALAISFGATSQAGATVHCQPNVKVTKGSGGATSIKVLNFKYKVGGNTIYTEGLSNKVLTRGETENWPSQTLNHAATGVVITESAVEIQEDNGRGYGPSLPLVWFPHSFTCGANHNYIHVIP